MPRSNELAELMVTISELNAEIDSLQAQLTKALQTQKAIHTLAHCQVLSPLVSVVTADLIESVWSEILAA